MGITVPPGDLVALAKAVQLLLNRDDLRAQFGIAAKARVESQFTTDRMADRTMALYKDVLANG
jgi:glycosyltransferase involved in cell wall biosynthesis